MVEFVTGPRGQPLTNGARVAINRSLKDPAIKKGTSSLLELIPLIVSIALLLNRARPRFVALRKVRFRFTRGGDILGPRSFKDILGFRRPFGIIAMDRQQYSALSDAALISFCFILRNTSADQRAYQSARRAAHSRTGQGRTDWSSCQAGSYPRYRNRPHPRQPTQ